MQNKSFACDVNTGSEALIASFVPAWDIANVSGIESIVSLATASTTLPAWWQFLNVGTCRQTSLTVNPTPAEVITTQCPDRAGGFESGGLAAYTDGFYGSKAARLIVGFAVPAASVAFLYGRREYFAYRITIKHAKTVGTGACASCTTPACILLSSVTLQTVRGTHPSRRLTPAPRTRSTATSRCGRAAPA